MSPYICRRVSKRMDKTRIERGRSIEKENKKETDTRNWKEAFMGHIMMKVGLESLIHSRCIEGMICREKQRATYLILLYEEMTGLIPTGMGKSNTFLRYTRDRILWRVMITHVLKKLVMGMMNTSLKGLY